MALCHAQPLTLHNLMIGGVTHKDVAYVATENDSVYAIDADNRSVLWQVSFINTSAGVTAVSATDVNCAEISPEIGITGTPVIDPVNEAIYLIAKTKENGNFVQRLHALNVNTGAEMFGGPTVITASIPGSGGAVENGQISFDPLMGNNRSGLLLENGHVVIAWASHCDNGAYHGWVCLFGPNPGAGSRVERNSEWHTGRYLDERRGDCQRFQRELIFSHGETEPMTGARTTAIASSNYWDPRRGHFL